MPIYEYQKKGKTHYRYAFEVKDQNGKRKTIKESGFSGKTEARKAEALARADWEKGQFISPSKLLFGDYITEWLRNKKNIGKQTRYTNEGHLKNHILPVLKFVPLQKLTYDHIEELLEDMKKKGLAEGTIKKVYNLVQTALKSAVTKELILRSPIALMDDSSKPTVKKTNVDYWTKEEVHTFLGNLNHRLKPFFITAIYTGMRRGELLGLRWKDIDFDKKQIRIVQTIGFLNEVKIGAKTSAGNRSITTSQFVINELKKHKELIELEKKEASLLNKNKYNDNDLVFCDKEGNPLKTNNFHKFWIRKIEATGVRKIRFHDLRHTCASLLFSAGVHPKIVQEMLGHSSIKVTLDLYSHMMPNMQEDAAKTLENFLKDEE